MNRLQNAWRPLLLGLVLLSVLVGVAGAVPTDQPSALSTRRQLMICAADFNPVNNTTAYSNNGLVLQSNVENAHQFFMAPVEFPYSLWVTIDKVELFAYDNNNTGRIETYLYLSSPTSGSQAGIAYLDTGFAYVDPVNDPHTWQDTTISPNVKNPANDVYVYVDISDDTSLWLYGVRIFYYMGR